MKMTVDVHAELLARAKRHAKETGQPLRAVVEDGLRRVLDAPSPAAMRCRTCAWVILAHKIRLQRALGRSYELIYGSAGAQ